MNFPNLVLRQVATGYWHTIASQCVNTFDPKSKGWSLAIIKINLSSLLNAVTRFDKSQILIGYGYIRYGYRRKTL